MGKRVFFSFSLLTIIGTFAFSPIASAATVTGQTGASISISPNEYETTGTVNFEAEDVKEIFAGDQSTYALMNDGTMWAWGSNGSGQLGIGVANGTRSLPQRVLDQTGTAPLSNVKQFSAGSSAAYAILDDGTVLGWGYGYLGQLAQGADMTNRTLPTTLKIDGTNPMTGVKYIAGGNNGAYAVMNDGTVKAWGTNFFGQLGNNTTGTAPAGIPTTVLTAPATPLTGAESVVSRGRTVYALLTNGQMQAWGAGELGQLGNGTTTAKSYLAVPVKTNASTNLTNIESIAGGDNNGYAVLNDGRVMAWGSVTAMGGGAASTYATQIASLSNIQSVSAGTNTAWALDNSGTLWAWGANNVGQIGNNNYPNTASTPVRVVDTDGVTPIADATLLAGSGQFTLAKKLSTDTLVAWGNGVNGQLGNNASGNRYYPVTVLQRPLKPKTGSQQVIVQTNDTFDEWIEFSIDNTLGKHVFAGGSMSYSLYQDDCATPFSGLTNPAVTVDSDFAGMAQTSIAKIPASVKKVCVQIDFVAVGDISSIFQLNYGVQDVTPPLPKPDDGNIVPGVPSTGKI